MEKDCFIGTIALPIKKKFSHILNMVVGSMEVPSIAFLLFFLFSDWLKSNHLRSRIERGVLDIS